jgi:hypothetical protein
MRKPVPAANIVLSGIDNYGCNRFFSASRVRITAAESSSSGAVIYF